jgi:acyl-CoA synthetase (AMP-forming)/AMP-acid ligase II
MAAVELPATVTDVLLRNASTRGAEPWLIDETTGLVVSHQDTAARVAAVASHLAARGVEPGSIVAVSLRNRPEFYWAWFGANWLGAAIVPMNTALTAREARFIAEHSGATAWIVDDDAQIGTVVAEAAAGLVESIIDVESITTWADASEQIEPFAAKSDTLASIIYTSGTTGDPKGCRCPHSYYIATGARFGDQIAATTEERFSTCLPLFHMNAQTMATAGSLVAGASLYLQERFHANGYWERLRSAGATTFNYIGAMPAILMKMDPGAADRDHGVRVAFGGGIPPTIYAAFEERFGLPVLEGYGLTETGLCVATPVHGDRKVGTGSCGIAMPGVRTRFIDDEGDEVHGAGPGELLIAGDGIFSGYHRLPREAAFDADGWFATGDILSRDADGYFYFIDRKKEIIRRAGENISPREVESVLTKHPAVAEVAVIGVTDEIRGQEVAAIIVLALTVDDSPETRESILDHARADLAYFKVPTRIEVRDSLPRTATQRVRKHLIREAPNA